MKPLHIPQVFIMEWQVCLWVDRNRSKVGYQIPYDSCLHSLSNVTRASQLIQFASSSHTNCNRFSWNNYINIYSQIDKDNKVKYSQLN